MAQAVYMLNCRELLKPALNKGMLQNKALFISLGLLLLLQTIVVFTPIAQNLIGTTPLNMMQQLLVLGHVAILFAIVEAEKWVTRRFSKRVSAQKVN